VSFLATIALSIAANLKHSTIVPAIIFSILAILATVVISILIPVFLILFLGALNSGKKDNRYKSGKKGNQNIIMAGIIAAIATLLVGCLIKNGNEDE
jgi:heme/copper-type cytochrome/quinol oxidase subunit 2